MPNLTRQLMQVLATVAVIALFSISGANAKSLQVTSCDGAPAKALLKIPPPIDDFAAVYCSNFGHFISGKPGMGWTVPGKISPVIMLADPSQKGDGIHISFFGEFSATLLGPTATEAAIKRYAKQHPWKGTNTKAFNLDTANNKAVIRPLVILTSKEQSGGFFCNDAACTNILIFSFVSLQ